MQKEPPPIESNATEIISDSGRIVESLPTFADGICRENGEGRVRSRLGESVLIEGARDVSGYWSESDLAESRRFLVSVTLHKSITGENIARIVGEHVARE